MTAALVPGAAWYCRYQSPLAYGVGLAGFLVLNLLGFAALMMGGPAPRGVENMALAPMVVLPTAYLTAYGALTQRSMAVGLLMWPVWLVLCVMTFSFVYYATLFSLTLLFLPAVVACITGMAWVLYNLQSMLADEETPRVSLKTHVTLLASFPTCLVATGQIVGNPADLSWARLASALLIASAGFAIHAFACWRSMTRSGPVVTPWKRVSILLFIGWVTPAALLTQSEGGAVAAIWPVHTVALVHARHGMGVACYRPPSEGLLRHGVAPRLSIDGRAIAVRRPEGWIVCDPPADSRRPLLRLARYPIRRDASETLAWLSIGPATGHAAGPPQILPLDWQAPGFRPSDPRNTLGCGRPAEWPDHIYLCRVEPRGLTRAGSPIESGWLRRADVTHQIRFDRLVSEGEIHVLGPNFYGRCSGRCIFEFRAENGVRVLAGPSSDSLRPLDLSASRLAAIVEEAGQVLFEATGLALLGSLIWEQPAGELIPFGRQ